MRRRTAVALVIVYVLSATAARAQDPSGQQAAVQQLLNEQLRRIEALEALLAQLRQEVNALRALPPPALTPPVDDTHGLQEPFVHAADGTAPTDPDSASPTADLPRAVNIDSYGSLRAMALW